MSVAIIDYGSGNLRSAAKAFQRSARESGYAGEVAVTSDPEVVRRADHIVLPGVGAFADCRRGLDGVPGMVTALEETVMKVGRPFLGICVGCQLMATRGLEKETTAGFGWIPGDVVEISPKDPELKIPHMGWNELVGRHPHPLLAGIDEALDAYFVHSYHVVAAVPEHVLATADYGGPVTAMIGRDNIAGTQFHPEKSQALGLALIANFLNWRP
ncbi:imidazole glycerol phosphate synthase subunit HisH [Afifella sp. H1R]|uniref:imidazole glycerol phosphate synthase subunit HisH n=1 Tax=Afifella sp. H1R TaxID=2908841 RepID=UPI001F21F4B0|nr:imidazole glycerol phosphate synthase subunit HisH [Afifella sp. H1R]MCF1505100.1 imidazole glycerol phosphate synthase subunit HisH [Afifella sp. H1R]